MALRHKEIRYLIPGEAEGWGEGCPRLRRADPWLRLQAPRSEIPHIHAWVNRIRVLEYLLMKTHPDRDHFRKVIDSQERRARDTARALIRSQDVSGTAAMPDVSWPPRGRATLVMDRRHTGHHRVRGGRGGLPGCPSPVAYCVLTLVTD